MNDYPKLLGFTSEEVKRLCSMMNVVWQQIGCDIMQAVEAGDGFAHAIPRAEVFEVVVDADRLRDACGPYGRSKEDKALVERFYKLPYDKMKKFAPLAFPFARYS